MTRDCLDLHSLYMIGWYADIITSASFEWRKLRIWSRFGDIDATYYSVHIFLYFTEIYLASKVPMVFIWGGRIVSPFLISLPPLQQGPNDIALSVHIDTLCYWLARNEVVQLPDIRPFCILFKSLSSTLLSPLQNRWSGP